MLWTLSAFININKIQKDRWVRTQNWTQESWLQWVRKRKRRYIQVESRSSILETEVSTIKMSLNWLLIAATTLMSSSSSSSCSWAHEPWEFVALTFSFGTHNVVVVVELLHTCFGMELEETQLILIIGWGWRWRWTWSPPTPNTLLYPSDTIIGLRMSTQSLNRTHGSRLCYPYFNIPIYI